MAVDRIRLSNAALPQAAPGVALPYGPGPRKCGVQRRSRQARAFASIFVALATVIAPQVSGTASAQTTGCEPDLIEVRLERDGGPVSIFRLPRGIAVRLTSDTPEHRDPRARCDLFVFTGREMAMLPSVWGRFASDVPGRETIHRLSLAAYNSEKPFFLTYLDPTQSLARTVIAEGAYIKAGDWYISRKYNTAILDPEKRTWPYGLWIVWNGSSMAAPISNKLFAAYDYLLGGRLGEAVEPEKIEQSVETVKALLKRIQVQ
jgi:hypothetical protein